VFTIICQWTVNLSHINPNYTLTLQFSNTTFKLSLHLDVGLPEVLFPSGFPIKIFYEFIVASTPSEWPTHLTFLDWTTLIIFGEV
jgi:hypothetical protein